MFDFQLKLSEYTLVYKKVDISEKMYIYISFVCSSKKWWQGDLVKQYQMSKFYHAFYILVHTYSF